ncbi:MAG: DUF4381 domain-containing protein [Sinobacteraceae bacterium]|nr:DUF4381 domain-containing protein [Nevskiaceae bacterium]
MNAPAGELSITLRDIHTPAGVSGWPLAAGWWGVIAVGAIVLAVLVWLWWRHRRPPLLSALAQHELETILAPACGDACARFVALHLLLRRLAGACPGGAAWRADTTGQWLDWLSRQCGLPNCPPALATQIASVPFQPPQAVDIEPLVERTRAIIAGFPPVRAGPGQHHAG